MPAPNAREIFKQIGQDDPSLRGNLVKQKRSFKPGNAGVPDTYATGTYNAVRTEERAARAATLRARTPVIGPTHAVKSTGPAGIK